jgi:dTDP-4-amino-4,6-dideoxygalactose transaminase
MNDVLRHARYTFGDDSRAQQLELLREVLHSGELGLFYGHMVRDLERRAAAYVGCRETIGVSSGTAALQLVLAALGIGPGHEVVIPEFGWVSVGGAVWALGADVRVAPIDEQLAPTWDDIAPRLGPRTRAVVVAHMRGLPVCGIGELAIRLQQADVALIEDCAQAWGTLVRGRHVGTAGTAAIFSTQAYKLVSTGEGGLVAANDPGLIRRVRLLQGDTRVPSEAPRWRLALRMSELQAAVALPQLERIEGLIARLTALQRRVSSLLAAHPDVRRVIPDPGTSVPDGARGNGTFAVAWFVDARSAARAHRGLRMFGIQAWRTGARGDLHFSHAWPTSAVPTRVDHAALLELPIPDLPAEDHESFLELLAEALKG